MASLIQLIQQYFIDPIYQQTGYNTVNTIVYGLTLGFAIILLEKLIIRLKIEIDRAFLIGILPFIVFATSLRSLVDAHIFPTSFFFVTPGIFFTTSVLYICTFILGRWFLGRGFCRRRRFNLEHSDFVLAAGSMIAGYPLLTVIINIEKIRPLFEILSIFILLSAATIFLISLSKYSNLKNNWIYGIFTAHYLDASATFVGIDLYGFFEEHIFENYLIELAGTALVIFPLKITVLLLVIYIIQKVVDKDNNREFWYLAIIILGFAAGLRNTFTIMLV